MENFFEWMSKPIPEEEVTIWFNMHNMNYEMIEYCGDFFISLFFVVNETFLGDENNETKIEMTDEDIYNHFEWCWNTNIENYKKENFKLKSEGPHKDYAKNFFIETFYKPKDISLKKAIPNFFEDVFNLDTPFTKSDLDLLTELYGLISKNKE